MAELLPLILGDQLRAKAFITLGGESLLFALCLQNPHLFKNDLGWCK
nr:hypothetical protein HMPREF0276_0800 [Corynebacterium accolens ATCC 49725]